MGKLKNWLIGSLCTALVGLSGLAMYFFSDYKQKQLELTHIEKTSELEKRIEISENNKKVIKIKKKDDEFKGFNLFLLNSYSPVFKTNSYHTDYFLSSINLINKAGRLYANRKENCTADDLYNFGFAALKKIKNSFSETNELNINNITHLDFEKFYEDYNLKSTTISEFEKSAQRLLNDIIGEEIETIKKPESLNPKETPSSEIIKTPEIKNYTQELLVSGDNTYIYIYSYDSNKFNGEFYNKTFFVDDRRKGMERQEEYKFVNEKEFKDIYSMFNRVLETLKENEYSGGRNRIRAVWGALRNSDRIDGLQDYIIRENAGEKVQAICKIKRN
jgi:hypothetical protein